jgi:hypothetical protein
MCRYGHVASVGSFKHSEDIQIQIHLNVQVTTWQCGGMSWRDPCVGSLIRRRPFSPLSSTSSPSSIALSPPNYAFHSPNTPDSHPHIPQTCRHRTPRKHGRASRANSHDGAHDSAVRAAAEHPRDCLAASAASYSLVEAYGWRIMPCSTVCLLPSSGILQANRH